MYTLEDDQINKPYPLGVMTEHGYTYFSVVMKHFSVKKKEYDCGIILYDLETGKETRIPFKRCNKYGAIYSMAIKDLDTEHYAYNFYEGETVFTDPYAKVIHGNEKWGKEGTLFKGGFLSSGYNWENEEPLKIPYENSILYCMNVRAFTKHKSSKVKYKGTYRGIIEKIPYLKELGITAVELMPAYEFDELEKSKQFPLEDYTSVKEESSEPEYKINCWGFKESYYFAPKAAFSAGEDTVTEFKDLVKELHRNRIEIIMQFYFPAGIKQGLILEAVKYWVLEYHIDGFHLKGERLPLSVIATEPLLTETKLFYYDFPYDEIYGENELPEFRNLASYRDDYMYAIRRFIKGDDDMLLTFLELQKRNPAKYGIINYITNYYGFTLSDMVSYERKHNEANGEHNKDGNDYNYTWNCGTEGASRKKAVCELRLQQMKNALTILFMSQGTPLIYSGDEFGNTRYGNNNPYCQDNETGWIKWNETSLGRELLRYTKSLITLKKIHPILQSSSEFKILDYIGCGYPDISYHGEEAWRPELGNYSRFAGVMYCGCYAQDEVKKEDNFFYIAYNMHWIVHTFALPKLPKGMKWHLIADTGISKNVNVEEISEKPPEEQLYAKAEARTIQIYISKQEEGFEPDKRQRYKRTAF